MISQGLLKDRICLSLTVILLSCSVYTAQDFDALANARAEKDFNTRIEAYISIHHQAEEESGLAAHPEALSSAKEIVNRKHTIAKHIALLRKNAHEGDVFTPEVKLYFTQLLDSAYQSNPETISTAAACAPRYDEQMVTVNAVYPDHLGFSMMSATMLSRIPPLPEELEYRIVNRDLIIRDREANLIVDVMRNAVPAVPESRGCND